jgi:hypothetical protein
MVESLDSYFQATGNSQTNPTVILWYLVIILRKTPARVNMLIGSPVFTTLGKTAGVVLEDCRAKSPRSEMKVTLKATHIGELMMSLDRPVPPKKPNKKNKKRKRGH